MPKSQWDATFNYYAEAVEGVTTPEEMLAVAPDYLLYALQQMPIQETRRLIWRPRSRSPELQMTSSLVLSILRHNADVQ